MRARLVVSATALLVALSFSACNGGAVSSAGLADSGAGTTAQGASPGPASGDPRSYQTAALVFAGSGTWGVEVASIESILSSHGATYREVDSAQLDAMSPAELASFGMLVFPGGSGGTEAGSLSSAAHANLRAAVREDGVGYVGFCAGAFIGQAPTPAPGGDVSYGLGIVNGPVLDVYMPPGKPNAEYLMTLLSFPDGSTEDILWYGGPVTPGGAGQVVAKYPNGEPAISEMWSGKGFVILSGPHPTATPGILSGLGLSSSDGTHTDLVWKMFNSVLERQPLPTF